MVDVKRPDFNYRASAKFANVNLRSIPQPETSRTPNIKKWARRCLALTLVLFIVAGLTLVFYFGSTKTTLEKQGEIVSSNIFYSLEAIRDFQPDEASASLEKSGQELSKISESFSAAFNFLPVLKEIGGFLKQLTVFNVDLLRLSNLLSHLQSTGFSNFYSNGGELIDNLTQLKQLVGTVQKEVEDLRNSVASLQKISYFSRFEQLIEENYLNYSSDLYALNDFLDGLLALLDTSQEKHLLLLFQNSSEIRPAGGFLGSYGDVVIRGGQMENLIVQDIYWPDHEMNVTEKFIPPEPLQRTTKDWGARDANWFFDFPASAQAVTTLLESSKIYKEHNITFEGVIAVNINVLETILEVTGPILLEEYDIEINAENFLSELQREVEMGRDKQAGDNPKRILSVLAPRLIEKLNNFSLETTREFIEKLGSHMAKKDIMVFMNDKRMAHSLQRFGADGSIYDLPSSFSGSYLAVVNANIAGGKSDAFVEQVIDVWIDVGTDGGTISDVAVKRIHSGENEKDWWYQEDNKDYIKIFTNPDSNLIFMKGNDIRRKITHDYDDTYSTYDILAAIEETKVFLSNYDAWMTDEFGKQVFATWLITPAGEKRELNIRYETQASGNIMLTSGKTFQFIFDRQSGAHTSLRVTVSAPLGYIWAESESPVFVYETDNPDKREIFTLTLERQFDEEFIEAR